MRLKDVRPGRDGSDLSGLVDVNGVLFFSAFMGTDGIQELWRSDGTEAGTVRVTDLWIGAGSFSPRALTPCLLIVSTNDDTGAEPRILAPSSVARPFPPRKEATSSSGASVSYAPAVLADGVPASTPIQYSHPPVQPFPLGSTVVQATTEVSSFQVRSRSSIVTVSDTTAPKLECPGSKVVEATDELGATVDYSPARMSDAVSEAQVPYSIPSGGRFPFGKTQVDITAKGAAHHTATCSFSITVQSRVTGPDTQTPEGKDSGWGRDTANPPWQGGCRACWCPP
ncbi:HYR domain-containing protein [Pyxidicoccus parkwayensis]|uniref:HYR domain-containing protein n=1 Tax=Pyxidicoccus parkwayensis TaxID=2813578 RepID=A0ABX7NV77_9BACT|nr:HYR domain-containing protein [Pyxidicoccus parkwaysis]QSQ22812.1 HYR domain-containing protein [Pyxidicoccus parkwaysis]